MDTRKVILECVDRGMSVLGSSYKEALLYHLQISFGIRKEEIPDKPQRFVEALRSILGEGAYILESAINRELASTFGLERVDSLMEALRQLKGNLSGKPGDAE